jgi:ketosteroid isomerase-like protein
MTTKIASRPGDGSEQAGAGRPTIESARKRLGGRATVPSARAPGSLVRATLRDGQRHAGVVLWASETHCDVWFDDGLARRTRAHCVSPCDGPPPEPLGRVAAEMRLFAALAEGDGVRWERGSGVAEGCIVEKCRYGAIVVTRDGKLVAVGFRKLWPAVVRSCA